MTTLEFAKKIKKMEGYSFRWNEKFYTSNDITSIYVNNEKIDVTEDVNFLRDEKGVFQASQVIDELKAIRKSIQEVSFQALMEKKDRKEAEINAINNL